MTTRGRRNGHNENLLLHILDSEAPLINEEFAKLYWHIFQHFSIQALLLLIKSSPEFCESLPLFSQGVRGGVGLLLPPLLLLSMYYGSQIAL